MTFRKRIDKMLLLSDRDLREAYDSVLIDHRYFPYSKSEYVRKILGGEVYSIQIYEWMLIYDFLKKKLPIEFQYPGKEELEFAIGYYHLLSLKILFAKSAIST